MMPAQGMAGRIAMRADAVAQADDFRQQSLTIKRPEIIVHRRPPRNRVRVRLRAVKKQTRGDVGPPIWSDQSLRFFAAAAMV
jgi:hypothetical protein